MERVIVSVKGGMVIDVMAPQNIDVIIRDYDVDGVREDLLEIDNDGDRYREMIW